MLIQAVIDNFSRRILAWEVRDKLDPAGVGTVRLLTEAAQHLNLGDAPTMVTDCGVENVNADVDTWLAGSVIKRVLAGDSES